MALSERDSRALLNAFSQSSEWRASGIPAQRAPVLDGNSCLTLVLRALGRRALWSGRAVSRGVLSFLVAFTAILGAPSPASGSAHAIRLPIVEGQRIRFTHLSTDAGTVAKPGRSHAARPARVHLDRHV